MPAQRPNARLGGGARRGPQMYTGGSPNFDETTGQYRPGYNPANARLGGGPGRGPQMYAGGSPNFDETTGQYRPGYTPPLKQPQVYPGRYPQNPGGMRQMFPDLFRQMPARAAGYFGGGPEGLQLREQYQADRVRQHQQMLALWNMLQQRGGYF